MVHGGLWIYQEKTESDKVLRDQSKMIVDIMVDLLKWFMHFLKKSLLQMLLHVQINLLLKAKLF